MTSLLEYLPDFEQHVFETKSVEGEPRATLRSTSCAMSSLMTRWPLADRGDELRQEAVVRQVREQALRIGHIDLDRLARRIAGNEQAYEVDAVAEARQVVIEESAQVSARATSPSPRSDIVIVRSRSGRLGA